MNLEQMIVSSTLLTIPLFVLCFSFEILNYCVHFLHFNPSVVQMKADSEWFPELKEIKIIKTNIYIRNIRSMQ